MSPHTSNLQGEVSSATQKILGRFGANAPREAEIRAQELRELGHLEAEALWLKIARAARKALDEHKSGR